MRISSLPSLARCPGFTELRRAEARRESRAANSGSAVGRAIELWHSEGEARRPADMAEHLERVLGHELDRWPLADPDDVRLWSMRYASDSRNLGPDVGLMCEARFVATLPAAPEDPTGEPVKLVGHVDQLRRQGGQLQVWDVKSSKGDGHGLTLEYAWQLAAYAVAATETLGEPVGVGGIIRLRGYERAGLAEAAPVFFAAPWTVDDCRAMLDSALAHLALVRSGLILQQPGVHCRWCPAEHPHLCGQLLEQLP